MYRPDLLGEIDAEQQRAVLGHVVGGLADRQRALGQDRSGGIGDDGCDRGRARVPARAPSTLTITLWPRAASYLPQLLGPDFLLGAGLRDHLLGQVRGDLLVPSEPIV